MWGRWVLQHLPCHFGWRRGAGQLRGGLPALSTGGALRLRMAAGLPLRGGRPRCGVAGRGAGWAARPGARRAWLRGLCRRHRALQRIGAAQGVGADAVAIAWLLAHPAGILPVVGVPLPFISYGGTALITLMGGFGLLMSIRTHR